MALAAVQTLDISPVGRVEGDLDVRVDVQDGVVVNAWTSAELFRGFEVILRDKDPQAGLVVTPRACGICGASHLTCASWALDTAWKTEVPRNAILARNLGQITESLQSLPRHHYGLFQIDMTNKNYRRSRFYEEAVRRWAPFTGTNYEHGVTMSGRPVEIYALLGGQWPHSSYMVPGGVMCAPTLTDVTRAWAILDHFRKNWLENMWLGCTFERYEQIKTYNDFMAWLDEKPEHANSDLGMYWRMGVEVGLDKYGRGHGKYISWGYLPHEDRYQRPTIEGRNAALIMKSGVYDGKTDTHNIKPTEKDGRGWGATEAIRERIVVLPAFAVLAAGDHLTGERREHAAFEGEGAMLLEAAVDSAALVEEDEDLAYPFAIPRLKPSGLPYVEPIAMWQSLLGDLILNTPIPIIAARFHRGLAKAIAQMAAKIRDKRADDGGSIDCVALSGGCFQNRILLEECERRLRDAGFRVFMQSKAPANDGGLALGQAAIAAARAIKRTSGANSPCA